ncbi:MAG: hypothetical protein JXA11_16970 [Phycisphaerae bacterium]|nr:hypothetical protein [Phycisphaerae bacterium]
MKHVTHILLLVVILFAMTVSVSGILSGCTSCDDASMDTRKPSANEEHRDDPDAFNDEQSTFEMDKMKD